MENNMWRKSSNMANPVPKNNSILGKHQRNNNVNATNLLKDIHINQFETNLAAYCSKRVISTGRIQQGLLAHINQFNPDIFLAKKQEIINTIIKFRDTSSTTKTLKDLQRPTPNLRFYLTANIYDNLIDVLEPIQEENKNDLAAITLDHVLVGLEPIEPVQSLTDRKTPVKGRNQSPQTPPKKIKLDFSSPSLASSSSANKNSSANKGGARHFSRKRKSKKAKGKKPLGIAVMPMNFYGGSKRRSSTRRNRRNH
jgi:hypothetical protein